MLAGAGDELQGMKKGIMEIADALVITKADGSNLKNAVEAQGVYQQALHLFPVSESGWQPTVLIIFCNYRQWDRRGLEHDHKTQ